MHTTTQSTSAQRPGPGGGGSALIVGIIAFAVVFLLIIGGTVGYLVLRSSGAEGRQGASSSQAVTTTPTTDPVTTPSESVEEDRCWWPEYERVSANSSGRLRGGGLEFIPPAEFTDRYSQSYASFVNDAQVATADIESSWVDVLVVGAVEWQPGIEYPGEKEASERILECIYANSANWGDTKNNSLHDQTTVPVTVAGKAGYKTTATLQFGEDPLEAIDATTITVVVVDTPDLDTPEGASVFISEIGVGMTDHEEGAVDAYDSLTIVAG
ncbi:hypothetical protein ACXET9_02530 [Brachybacterium sp. DNPG3]